MKKHVIYFYCCILLFTSFWAVPAQSTHIVGGEIQVKFVREYNYDFILNLYFDLINGVAGAKDQSIRISIFSKGTNMFMDSLRLPIVFEQQVAYSNPACNTSQLKTQYIRYARNLTLSPSRYNNMQGYYVIWERCCRNNVISNIVTPGDVGMTFYTEIPRISEGQNQAAFVNSTPAFNIPKGDYLCANRPFTLDFGATDSDGDFLQYSLVTPLAGHSRPDPNSLVIPDPTPAPYAPIIWRSGYNASNAIPNNPSIPANKLNVDVNTGVLRVTPSLLGLYVLSVKCEEYRNGTKIGEVRRDFQFLVIDCPINNKPEVKLQTGTQGGQATYYQEGQTITLTPANLCLTIWGKDIDNPENVVFSMKAINFQLRSNLLSVSSGTVFGSTDSLKTQLCWDKCLFSEKDQNGIWKPFIFDLIIADDGCPSNLTDTIRVQIIYLPISNSPPTLSSDAPIDASAQYNYTMTRLVGQAFEFNITGLDIDNDLIALSMEGQGFSPADLGMQFEPKSALGNVQSKFYWLQACKGVKQQNNEFILEFILKEETNCEKREKKITVKLLLIDTDVDLTSFLPPNAFSPNGDSHNPTFEMSDLPKENCRYLFERITIYNRWGGKVFESTDRNFKWNGGEYPAATYFYTVDFKGKQYKGTVSMLK